MFSLPEPLHPVVLHFPIVLLLIGGAVAAVAVFLNRWHLPWIAAALLLLGAVGTFVAAQTGESAQEIIGDLPPAVEELLDAHKEWAERTEIVAGIAAGLALVAGALGASVARRDSRWVAGAALALPKHAVAGRISLPALAFTMRTVTAAVALLACVFVYETGHRGGRLVYDYGVGTKHTAGQAATATNAHVEDD